MSAQSWELACPLPLSPNDERITLAHGEGGRLTRQLIHETIRPALENPILRPLGDAASLSGLQEPLAMTTDSFVVSPLFFPGGDIGTLAVYGTVNDLSVSGARPRWLSLSLILEEGLPIPVLERILRSAADAAQSSGMTVVTGDTKVVPSGTADGLFLNTTGLGALVDPVPPGPQALQPGDELIVTGPIGRHGIAVLAAREDLGFEPLPQSDCAPLVGVVEALRRAGIPVRAMRDATRGGVAAVLHEWAHSSGCTMTLREWQLPVSPDVRGACELLGLDPLHIACEGTMVVAVPQDSSARALEAVQTLTSPPSSESAGETAAGPAVVGTVRARGVAPVTVRRALGTEQPLDEPAGAPLPRIC